jgi:hypothetical protein
MSGLLPTAIAASSCLTFLNTRNVKVTFAPFTLRESSHPRQTTHAKPPLLDYETASEFEPLDTVSFFNPHLWLMGWRMFCKHRNY